MRFFIIAFLLLIFSVNITYSQQFGNDWISHNQSYYKIKITENAIYRIYQQDLLAAGVDGSYDPRNFQIFRDGQEIPIYVHGESDGIFAPGEYIEFAGKKNNAWFDSLSYPLSHIVNPDNSLYSDTAVYFLTWNLSQNNKRYVSENQSNIDSYTPQQYCRANKRLNLTGFFNPGAEGGYISNTEGWVDNYFDKGRAKTFNLNTSQFVANRGESIFDICVVGFSDTEHNLSIRGPGVVFDTLYRGHNVVRKRFLSNSSLANESQITVSSLASDLPADKNCVSYISVNYPHSFNLSGKSYFEFQSIITSSTNFARYDIQNFESGSNQVIIYDLSNQKRATMSRSGNTYRVLLSNQETNPQLIISSAEAIKTPLSIAPVNSFNSNTSKFFDFLTLSGNYIIITHKSLRESATEYANYRTMMGASVVVVDVDELYNQFGYGNYKHPGAIKNFLKFAYNRWITTPEFVFLIGKSYYLNQYRNNHSLSTACLVPSMGYPPSDVSYGMGLSENSYLPQIAVGRLAASNNENVTLYLNKVREYENNQPDEWMKHILHFGGGGDIYEQTWFESYLRSYKNIIESDFMGASVSTFLKKSSLAIEQTQSDYIQQRVNEGTSMLTFFGHASGEGFDQNIDAPTAFSNKGKYPFILANSCYTGDIHTTGTNNINEKWIFIENKGAICFFAGVGSGYPAYLNHFSRRFYENIATTNYGKSVGHSINNTIRQLVGSSTTPNRTINICLSMTLHGDPLIKINSFEFPDLKILPNSISFSPEYITNTIDSFDVKIAIVNAGKTFDDVFNITITRSYPNGDIDTIFIEHEGLKYIDTLTITMPVNIIKGVGTNNIKVELDSENIITEYNETNNNTSVDFLITSTELMPIWPYDLSIIPSKNIELIASSVSYSYGTKKCIFEIDTVKEFNSTFRQSNHISFTGTIVNWQLPFELENEKVYYWRVANVPDNENDGYNWKYFSFRYIDGISGWGQSTFNQIEQCTFDFIVQDSDNKKYEFVNSPKRLLCNTVGLANNNAGFGKSKYLIDGTQMDWGSCGAIPTFNVAVIDPVSLEPWFSYHGEYGHRNYPGCGPEIDKFLCFTSNNAVARQNLANFLRDTVPDGHYVLVFTFISGNFASVEENLVSAFESLGAKDIRHLQNDLPYIFFAKKGDITTAKEVAGNNPYSEISLETDMITNYNQGFYNSPLIGPSSEFNYLQWDIKHLDSSEDSVHINIIGVNKYGQEILLANEIGYKEITNLDTIVDADIYPYIKLKLFAYDDLMRTPSSLYKWEVYYKPIPEITVDLDEEYHFYDDTLQQGDELKLIWKMRNISTQSTDSILVGYYITANNETVYESQKRLGILEPMQWTQDTFLLKTENLSGRLHLKSEINTINKQTQFYDQLEQYRFNNVLINPFYVELDVQNPLIDVKFDGIRIMDKDLVSAKPLIEINLYDENPFFALNDPSLYDVYLDTLSIDEEVNGINNSFSTYNIVDLDTLEFISGTTTNNKSSIIFRPIFTQDGTYILRVNAKDRTGNVAGTDDFAISFRVITKSTITKAFNYPNPFSNYARFFFELTGSELPTEFKIQIMSATGQIVREIGLDEIGSINIGRCLTHYAWDGRDMYGNLLANGVYFFKIIAKINNTDIEYRYIKPNNFNIDKNLKDGIGKMLLIR